MRRQTAVPPSIAIRHQSGFPQIGQGLERLTSRHAVTLEAPSERPEKRPLGTTPSVISLAGGQQRLA